MEIARVSPGVASAPQSRSPRSRASFQSRARIDISPSCSRTRCTSLAETAVRARARVISHCDLARDRAHLSTDHARIAISLAEIVRDSLHMTLALHLARRVRACLSTAHARITISLVEIVRVCPHIMLASQSRLPRLRASPHISRSRRSLACRGRARLFPGHTRIAISLAEIARVSPHITLASQSRPPRSRASLYISCRHRNLAC